MFTRLLSSLLVFTAATSLYAQQWEWVDNSNGTSNLSTVEDLAVDSTRDVIYAVGYVDGTPNFSEIPNADYSGQEDGFVMKYDLDGNVLYGFLIGGAGLDRINGVAVDQATGNVFITGYIEGAGADLTGAAVGSPGAVTGNFGGEDAFVAMYNVFGQLVWYKLLGGVDRDRGMDIAVNSSAVFITGLYTNSAGISLFPLAISTNTVVNNMVVAFDKTNGNIIWDAVQGSSDDDFDVPSASFDIARTGITADDNGVYAVNYFYGATYDIYNSSDILSASLVDPQASSEDFVVTAYSNAGAYNWSALYDNIGSPVTGLDITSDCDGVYVTGSLHNGSTTPGGTVISSNHDDVIISKLNKSNGNEIWLKEFDSNFNHYDYFVGLHADGYGNLYATGRLRGTSFSSGSDFSFTGGAVGSEPMIAHYHTDGTFQSFDVIPASTYSWGMSIATYKNEKYVVGGYYNDMITFGSIVPPSANDNAFIALRDLTDPIGYVSTAGNIGFCQAEPDPTPIMNAPAGGTFSGPPQVDFVDVNTGEIDLSASTPGGPFTITYSGFSLGCATTAFTFDIYIAASPAASFTYAESEFCTNEANPTPASITTAGGTFTAPSGLALADPSTGEIDLAGSTPGGPYWLVYTTSGFCSLSDSLQITINSAPNANFGYGQTTYCTGTGTVSPSFIVIGGGTFTGPVGLVFNASSGEIDLDASTAGGPYTIVHSVNGTNCQETATFDVTILQTEDASFTYANTTLCTNDPNTWPTSVTSAGGVFSAQTGLNLVNTSTGEIEVSTSTVGGPYQLYYTTNGGTCPATDSLEFNIVAAVDPTFAYAQSSYCSDDGTVLPSLVASPGGTFSGPLGVVFISTTTGEIDLGASTPGGPYSIQYLAGSSPCQTSTTYNLTINQSEDASFSYGASAFCQNEADPSPTSITTPGGIFSGPTELDFNALTGEIYVATSTAGGPYWLVYTTGGPTCPSSDSIQMSIEAAPDALFAFSQSSYCQNGTNPVPSNIATAGGSFTASAGLIINPGTGEIDVAASTVGGPYTIQHVVTNAFCSDSTTFDVTINPTDDASFAYAAGHFCQNEANPVPSSIATPGGTFSGQAGLVVASTTGEIDVVASTPGGPYWIVYTTASTCPSSDSVQVNIETAPDPSFGYTQSVYCANDANPVPSPIATAGGIFSASAGLTVNPSTGEIDLAGSIPGGPYTIQYLVTNTYCSDSATFDVTITPADDASFSYATGVFCNNEANPIPNSITTPGGTFSGSAGLTVASASGEIDVLNSTTGVSHVVTYTTNGPCPVSETFAVLIEDAPDASFAYAQSAYCNNETNPIPISIATTGGTFTATSGLVINPSTGEIDLAGSPVGTTYTIQYIVSNTNCQDTSTFNITINQSDDASFAYAAVHFCNNEADPIPSSITTSGGTFTGPTEIDIDPSTGEIDVSTSNVGGPYWIVYSTVGTNCPNSDSVEVYIESAPNAFFDYSQASYCQGAGTIASPSVVTTGGTFSAPAGVVIDATTGEIDVDASTAGGPYTIQYTVSNTYCQKTYPFDVTIIEQDELLSVGYAFSDYCVSDGNQVPGITGVSGGTFTGPSSIDIVNATTGEISPSSSVPGGPYTIQYLSPGVCPDSIEVLISIFDLVSAYGGEDQELFFIFSSSLEADIPLNASGEWSTVSTAIIDDEFDVNSEVTNLELGTNTFVWTVSNGVCPAESDEVIIEVEDIFIPQAVTPNNDGKNDFFELSSLDNATCSLQIFNRWGQLVYENSDYQNEWNGQNAKGDELKNDTYFYTILINDSLSFNGYVVLKK